MTRTVRVPRTGAALPVRREHVGGLDVRTWTADEGGAGPDVVLVHGLGTSAATFERLVPHLTPAATVHLLDLPGFARVPRPREPLGVADLAALVATWVERAGLDRPTLVGHSMGTQVVAEAAAAHPGTASGVVLVGPTVDEEGRTATRQLVRLAGSSVHESGGARRVVLRGYVECGPRWYLATLRGMLEHRMEDRLPYVDVPVLVVRGERDRVAPESWTRRLAALAPQGRAVTVPGAAHVAMYSHADRVADLVLAHAAR